MSGNTKIRGRQIETDDFIKSVRNADVDWTNDANTASQKAIAAMVAGKFKVVNITYANNVYSSDTRISDIISMAANGYYVLAFYCVEVPPAHRRGKCLILELSYFEDMQTNRVVGFENIGYGRPTDTMEFLMGKQQYLNGRWSRDDWVLEGYQPDYKNLLNKPAIPDAVSGTNDGTNWTSITIGSTTKLIPQGGGGSGGIMTVTDDGNGNVSIFFNPSRVTITDDGAGNVSIVFA